MRPSSVYSFLIGNSIPDIVYRIQKYNEVFCSSLGIKYKAVVIKEDSSFRNKGLQAEYLKAVCLLNKPNCMVIDFDLILLNLNEVPNLQYVGMWSHNKRFDGFLLYNLNREVLFSYLNFTKKHSLPYWMSYINNNNSFFPYPIFSYYHLNLSLGMENVLPKKHDSSIEDKIKKCLLNHKEMINKLNLT